MSQVQFYRSVVNLGGAFYPIMPGARFTCPANYAIPPVVGNRWQLNFQEGLRQPMVDLSFFIFDSTTGVLGTTFLNYFLTRTNDYADDTSVVGNGTLTFYDGWHTVTMSGVKADTFTLGSSKGDDLRLQARFCGSSINITTPVNTPPSAPAWSRTPLLRFQSVQFTSTPFQNAVWNFNLTYSNNHTPNNALNGTSFPVEMNAGLQAVTFSCMTQTNNQFVDNGLAYSTNSSYASGTESAQGGIGTNTSPQNIVITVNGNSLGTRTFTLNNPVLNTPDEMNVTIPRNMKSWSYALTGLDGLNTPPLTIS